MARNLVRHFHVLHFHVRHFQRPRGPIEMMMINDVDDAGRSDLLCVSEVLG